MVGLFVLCVGVRVAGAVAVQVTSEPAGAEAYWSAAGDPALHTAGPTPVAFEATGAWPLRVVVRLDGRYPVWRELDSPPTEPLHIELPPVEDDVHAVTALGWPYEGGRGPRVAALTDPRRGWRVATAEATHFVDDLWWSPDARYAVWGRAYPSGDAELGEDEHSISVLTLLNVTQRRCRRLEWVCWGGSGYIRCNAAWTKDGEYLLHTVAGTPRDPERVDVLEVSTGAARTLLSSPDTTYYLPAVAGDGRVAYVQQPLNAPDDEAAEVWTCRWDGTGRTRLGPWAGAGPCGTADGWLLWSTDDGMVAWREGEKRQVLPAEAGPPRRVIPEPAGDRVLLLCGDWPDDFAPPDAPPPPEPTAFIWSADHGAYQLPTTAYDIEWLPGGRLLAEHSILDLQGQVLDRLETPPLHSLGRPCWSPDGQRLAVQDPSEGGLWAVPLDGSAPTEVVPEHYYAGEAFAWGPGGRLAVATSGPGAGRGAPQALLVADGPGAPLRTLAGDLHPRSLSWSPDGSQIACVTGALGEARIALVAYPSGEVRYITPNGLWDSALWHPTDAGRIAFSQQHDTFGGCGATSYGIIAPDGTILAQSDQTLVHAGAPHWCLDGELAVGQSAAWRWSPTGVSPRPRFSSWLRCEVWDEVGEQWRDHSGECAWSGDGRVAVTAGTTIFVFAAADVRGDAGELHAVVRAPARPLQVLHPFGEPPNPLEGVPAPTRLDLEVEQPAP